MSGERETYPCVCVNCKRRSEPRPLGQIPYGWSKVDGYYVCSQCRPPARDIDGRRQG